MKCFCDNCNFKNLIKQWTCYKNPGNPTCLDLLLTNAPRNFQSTSVLETGLSNFHLMTLTVARKCFKKLQPRIINYRSYKILLSELRKEDFVNNDIDFEKFCNISMNVLNKMLQGRKKMLVVIKRLLWQKIFPKK